MFKHSCFIENSKEAREWLESIGCCEYIHPFGNDYPYLFFLSENGEYLADQIIENDPLIHEYINCLGNLPLFKALTVIRDDSDYMQWFTDGKEWQVSISDDAGLAIWEKIYRTTPHKATKEELIEKFKN